MHAHYEETKFKCNSTGKDAQDKLTHTHHSNDDLNILSYFYLYVGRIVLKCVKVFEIGNVVICSCLAIAEDEDKEQNLRKDLKWIYIFSSMTFVEFPNV